MIAVQSGTNFDLEDSVEDPSILALELDSRISHLRIEPD
jgi:hypothetical protein